MHVREPLQPPSRQQRDERIPTRSHTVSVYHPFYEEEKTLLSLGAFDIASGGIHHETLRIACAIIANNRFDGFLSETITPGLPLSKDTDDVLPPGRYYFHVPGESEYAVVPGFRHWQYPHRNVPQIWTELERSTHASRVTTAPSDISPAVRLRDTTCRVSGYAEIVQVAHLCPQTEEPWVNRNAMEEYAVNPSARLAYWTNNALLLRADLNFAFDARKFVFLPKSGKLVVHVLEASEELLGLYHNVEMQPSASGLGVGVAFLFSRFAWTIFHLAANTSFSRCLEKRRRAIYNPAAKTRLIDAIDLSDIPKLDGSRSRSQSPQKRSRSTHPNVIDFKEQGQSRHEPPLEEAPGDGSSLLLGQYSPAALSRIPKRDRESSCSLTSNDAEENTHPFIKRFRKASQSLSTSSSVICNQQIAPQDQHQEERTHSNVALINESARIQALREEALRVEQKRSDTRNAWEEEQTWMRSAIDHPQSAQSMRRLLAAMGYEIEAE